MGVRLAVRGVANLKRAHRKAHLRLGKTSARFVDVLLNTSRTKARNADQTWTASEPSRRLRYASRNANASSFDLNMQ